jgi:hypothetical protein
MPPGPAAPCSLAGLLAVFRPCFTAPTFQTFVGLVVGLIAQTRRRSPPRCRAGRSLVTGREIVRRGSRTW